MSTPPARDRKRWALLAALIGLGTCAVLRSRTASRSAAPEPSPPSPVVAAAQPAAGVTTPANPLPARRAAAIAPPIIDEVVLEKTEVCEGEENLVTVRAHTPDGNDAFLHFQVGPTSGSSVPLHSYLDHRGNPTAHRISVFSKNNVATTVDVPSFRVKRCDGVPMAALERRLRPNTFAEFDFDVRILGEGAKGGDGGAPSFRPTVFRWSFGDGTHEDGTLPRATHDFAARPQDKLYSQFVVSVEVVGQDGTVLRARQSVELLNPAFETLAYKGIVQLFIELDPRFPVLSANDVVDQGVRLWHAWPEAVEITKITVTTQYMGGAGRSPRENPPVGDVLGATQIPPGHGLELHAVIDTRLEPDTSSRDYYLEGRTPDGHTVRGAFSVMRPPPRPTKESHDPIIDPALLAKVKIAREVLHREYVTDEDLWALERAGHFAHLRVEPSSGPQAPASAPQPPRPKP